MSARIVTLICTVVFILFLAAFPLQAQTTWYVDDDAPNDPGPGDPSVSDPLEDGSTAHPFDAIQEAIDASSGGDTVQVADGTYTGDGNRDLDYGGKAITVMSENGAEQCIIDCQGGESNPHRGFNFHSGEGSSSVVHGFTIRNGYSSGSGGGIHCANSSPMISCNIITENSAVAEGAGINCWTSSPTITQNTISSNTSGGVGGGIWCWQSSPDIDNNIITNNTAQGLGGGINCNYHSNATISDNTITINTANSGAGIVCDNSAPFIDNNMITDNIAQGWGGGITCRISSFPTITNNTISRNTVISYTGGGIFCNDSSPMIINNSITENLAGGGGGINCWNASPKIISNNINGNNANGGGGIKCEEYSTPMIMSNTISNNIAQNTGGGINCQSSSPTITDNVISNNTATSGHGGGIRCWEASPSITYNLIFENTANGGGGIACTSDSLANINNNSILDNIALGWGGGVYCHSSSSEIVNNIIAGNSVISYSGGGVFCNACSPLIMNDTIFDNAANGGGGINCWEASPIIINSIVWSNSPSEIRVESGDPIVNFSNILGGWLGTGNINADPLFVTGPEGDYYLSQIAAGQASDSPCLDAGSDPAANICFETGCMEVCMDLLTTRTDHVRDSGMVDMGYHYGYSSEWCTVSTSLTCQPSTGTVPFSTQMAVTIENLYAGQIRRISARINATLASGAYFGSWRAGFTNVTAGSCYSSSWLQNIPALGSLIGPNLFELVAEDVTPAPYNQPPYPPAGDTDTATCTVTGITP